MTRRDEGGALSGLGSRLLTLAAITACGPVPSEAVGSRSFEIQGGELDGRHDFSVGVIRTAVGRSPCSGVLLSPTLVATAQHCVAPVRALSLDCATTTFGERLDTAQLQVTTAAKLDSAVTVVGVREIVVPQGPGTEFVCGHDVALLVLQEPLVVDRYAEPALSPSMTVAKAYSNETVILGYGLDSPTDLFGESIGVRRIKTHVAVTCISEAAHLADCQSEASTRRLTTANDFMLEGSSACHGDSGSAAYDQAAFDRGRWLALGVLSRGNVSDDGLSCDQPVYTRFDTSAELLLAAARRSSWLTDSQVPDWAEGFQTADGVACRSDRDCRSGYCGFTQGQWGTCASHCDERPCNSGFACLSGSCWPEDNMAAPVHGPFPEAGASTSCTVSGRPRQTWPAAPMALLGLAAVSRVLQSSGSRFDRIRNGVRRRGVG